MAENSAGKQVHRLGHEAIHTYWDSALPPALTIAPGDTVVFATLEASHGRVARAVAAAAPPDLDPVLAALIAASAYPEVPTLLRGHPLTGPVYVAGAAPGDTLRVTVLDVQPGAWGWTACGPGNGLLGDEFTERVTQFWDLRHGERATFAPGIRVPLAPFCGVLGVALAEPGMHATTPPGMAGGNLDIRQLTAGATLDLPVLIPGALFSTGDAHAAQGDGEVSGTAIETDATVTLRFDLLKGRAVPGPQFRTPGSASPLLAAGPVFATTGHGPDLYGAARVALRGIVDYLATEHGLSRPRACILASVCADLRISQIVNRPNWTVSALLPLAIFADE
jgi:acetamidase/formamidase